MLVAIGFLPQFGGPGYESALAAGLVLPSLAAIASALAVVRSRPAPAEALAHGALYGALLALLGAAIATLHGLRTGFCDASLGYELWLCSPAAGAILGGVWGSCVGYLALRFRRARAAATVFALLGPLGGVLVSLVRFYTSPMVFAFDPFAGYFAGPLYDTVIDPQNRLLSYRAGSFCTLVLAGLVSLHARLEGDRLRFRAPRQLGLVFVGLAAALGSAGVTFYGSELGHYSTASSIDAALGRSLSVGRCQVVYSAGIVRSDADRVARECVGHLPEIERYFGVRGPERVKVLLFASNDEKGRLMGAFHTYIAKPWRAEVYVQAAGFPHPTLGHELAHVISGSFGSGPFQVAGPLAGLIPDPGRIEGVAVAASPGEDDDFTLLEWSKALLDLGLLPPLESVFRLGFLAKSSSTAYTVAGAFVSFFHDRYGAPSLRAWYAGADIANVTGGKSLAMLDGEFRQELAQVQLRPELLAMAKARFDRPSIFGRVCPRRVDRDLSLAESRLAGGDVQGAREAFHALLDLDPTNSRAKLRLAACDLRAGELEAAVTRYRALAADPALTRLEQVAATEARGDVEILAMHFGPALEAYAEVASVDADEDRQRTLDVKRAATKLSLREAIVRLLIGDPVLGPSWDEAAPRLGALAELPNADGGLASYLLGRNLWMRGRTEEAARHLDRAILLGTSLPRVDREALRLRIIMTCADQSLPRAPAEAALSRWLADPAPTTAQREALQRLAARFKLEPKPPAP